MGQYRVTVDTGGTFSDFVYVNEETDEVSIAKIPSTPDDPSRAILSGVQLLIDKGVLQFTDLPEDAQRKLRERASFRGHRVSDALDLIGGGDIV